MSSFPDAPQSIPQTDPLSSVARRVMRAHTPHAYARLVVPMTPTDENETIDDVIDLLDNLAPADLFDVPIRDPLAAACVHAGLLIYHDRLDAAHAIAQVVDTNNGVLWHAVIHRREGDFANAKYWYARCRKHPCLATIAANANELLRDVPADKTLLKLTLSGWSGAALVDLVEAVHGSPRDPRHEVAVMLQRLEWRHVFDQCVREAT